MRMLGILYLLTFSAFNSEAIQSNQSNLVVILLDGFRWDYLPVNASELPGFGLIWKEGATAAWVNPVFPSHSSPGWLTIATGLYPESHQIIGDVFQDPSTGVIFNAADEVSLSRPIWWQDSEPLWVTATKMGIITSVYSWGRCEIEIDGIRPAFCDPFRPNDSRFLLGRFLRQALYDLKNGFRLVMMLTDHVDRVGHEFGPESPQVKKAIVEVDTAIAIFLDRIMQDGVLNTSTNVIVTSSHGMRRSSRDADATYYRLEDFVAQEDVDLVLDRGAVMQVLPRSGREDKLVEQLSKIPNVQIYTKDSIPEWFHYQNGKYVQGILLLASPGTVIEGLPSPKQHPRDSRRPDWAGLHGYDPIIPDMRGICTAWGPAFPPGVQGGPLEAVDVYRLMADTLGLVPTPNNSSWERIGWMLGSSCTVTPSNTHLALLVLPWLARLFHWA